MSSYNTNGYVVQRLISAADKQTDKDHAEADKYLKSFRSVEENFFEKVHPFVDVGLAISETQASNVTTPNIFTVHGSRHISDLIRSLDKLAQAIAEDNKEYALTVLEAYVLLCAAHVHDAANVKERAGHPQRAKDVLQQYKELFSSPATIQQIYDVARVHGDSHERFGKDTFRDLDADNSSDPRLPLLASLIRLGDELSENPERVPDLVNKNHDHSDASKLAHAYAKSFASFELRKDTLYVVFNIYPMERNLKLGENPTGCNTFIDYLETKIDVIERESRYCSQYGRPMLNISKIAVLIRTFKEELPSAVDGTVKFDLQLTHGYPTANSSLCQRSPQLIERKIAHLSECF